MIKTFINIIFLLGFSLNAYAQNTRLLTCPIGHGIWVNSEGLSTCRKCPEADLFLSEEPLKIPEGCKVFTYGTLIKMPKLKELVAHKERSVRLDSFFQEINPLLSTLKSQILIGNRALETLKNDYEALQSYNRNLKTQNESYKSSIKNMHYVVYTVSTVLIGVVSYIAFR